MNRRPVNRGTSHPFPATHKYDIIDVMKDRGSAIYEVLQLVRPVVLNSARVVAARVRELGWSVGSRAVVEVLLDLAPATVPRIAAQLSLARQNVQRHVNELIQLGHVQTRPNPAHRRSVLVELTLAGREAFVHVHALELEELAPLADTCSDDELAAATTVLAALNRDIAAQTPGN